MNREIEDSDILKIPIKINEYDELFNELDYRKLENRQINKDIDSFIDDTILRSNKKIKDIFIELIIYMPSNVKDEYKQIHSQEGILNYYKGYFEHKKVLNMLGIKRIIYYVICSLILLIAWYYVSKYKGESFITSLLNAGGTVLLWEIMSLIFIERRNSLDKAQINKKISNMKIIFKYI